MGLLVKEIETKTEIDKVCDFMKNNITQTLMRSQGFSSASAKTMADSIKFTNPKELISILSKKKVICYSLFFNDEIMGVSVFNQENLTFLFLGSHLHRNTIEILKILLKKNLMLPVVSKKEAHYLYIDALTGYVDKYHKVGFEVSGKPVNLKGGLVLQPMSYEISQMGSENY